MTTVFNCKYKTQISYIMNLLFLVLLFIKHDYKLCSSSMKQTYMKDSRADHTWRSETNKNNATKICRYIYYA